MRILLRLLCLMLAAAAAPAGAEIRLRDGAGEWVRLPQPARRIVSLAPHVTENLYAAGAGDRLVAASEFSDYPEPARALPRIGSSAALNLEAILALKPDLVIGWASGNPPAHLARLRALGIPLYLSQPARIEDIAVEIERFGALAGTQAAAVRAAAAFRARQAELAARYRGRPPVRTFYQIWHRPLMTVNGEHLISDALRLCGGENVFAGLPSLAAAVTVEAVLAADPEAVVASGMDIQRPEWLDAWKRWRSLTAVARDNLFSIAPELMQRHTPRILDGAGELCAHLETARSRRSR